MALAKYLIDKSAYGRIHLPEVAAVIEPLMSRALVGTCGLSVLEILYSARSGHDHRRIGRLMDTIFEWLPTEDLDFARAREVSDLLAQRAQHRAIGVADLLIAAVAERHRVTVLHYDADYDLIAEITGQAAQWVMPRGSVP